MINENRLTRPQVSRYTCDAKTKEINSRRYSDLRSRMSVSGDASVKQKVAAVSIALSLLNHYRRPR